MQEEKNQTISKFEEIALKICKEQSLGCLEKGVAKYVAMGVSKGYDIGRTDFSARETLRRFRDYLSDRRGRTEKLIKEYEHYECTNDKVKEQERLSLINELASVLDAMEYKQFADTVAKVDELPKEPNVVKESVRGWIARGTDGKLRFFSKKPMDPSVLPPELQSMFTYSDDIPTLPAGVFKLLLPTDDSVHVRLTVEKLEY